MKALINQINLINAKLIIGIKGTYKAAGLVKEVSVQDEKHNFEYQSGDRVFIDDSFKSYFYHKINGEINYNRIKSPGKTNVYNAIASISLICYSEFNDFEEHILNRLGQVKLLTIKSNDLDSNKIISNETGKGQFDFKKFLFVVNYQILYKTENCYEVCQ